MTACDSLRVLFYHRIGDSRGADPRLAPELIAATVADFENQMRYVAHAYHPVAANEVLQALTGRHALPARALLVTFDDAYRDFLELAWPVLRRHHLPCTLFVATAFVDEPGRLFWWDQVWQYLARTSSPYVVASGGARLPLTSLEDRRAAWRQVTAELKAVSPSRRQAILIQLAESLRVTPERANAVLSWTELRQLASEGVAIGGHTRTHELLDQLDGPSLKWEIDGCRDDLVRELGGSQALFAYPNGNFSPSAEASVAAAGYQLAFATLPGLNEHWREHQFALRRDGPSTSFLRFAVKLIAPVARRRARRALVASA